MKTKIWQPEQRLDYAAVRKGAAGCQAVGQTGSTPHRGERMKNHAGT